MLDELVKILVGFGIKSVSSQLQFTSKVQLLALPKNKLIFEEGKKNESEFIIVSGILHRFNTSLKGDCITTGFYLPGFVITPHFARTNNLKSLFSLQSLTNVVLAEIKVIHFDELRHTNLEFQTFGQRVAEAELSGMIMHDIIFRSYTAKERIVAMRKQFPNLENLIPHNVIASYLGITNVSFSRLRNELAK